MSGSPQWSLSLRFPHQNPVHASLIPHVCYMPCPIQKEQGLKIQCLIYIDLFTFIGSNKLSVVLSYCVQSLCVAEMILIHIVHCVGKVQGCIMLEQAVCNFTTVI